MDGSVFEYQTMMYTVLNGMAGKMIPAIQNVSYILMMICLVMGIYEAYAKGGDTRQLATTFLKYVVVAFIVGNWTTFFTDVMTGFNAIAQYIDDSYGAGDLMKDWSSQLADNFQNNGYTSIWNIIANGGAAIVNALEIAVAYVVFPLAVQIFTLIYIFWGAVVFAVGPLVLALAPSQLVNSTAKFYAVNMVVWNCWTVVYAIFACLITAVNGKDITTSPFFASSSMSSVPQILVGMTSILYAICILLIPVIAYVVLKAEFRAVGGALLSVISTANQTTAMINRMMRGAGAASGVASTAAGGSGGGSYLNGTVASNISRPPNPTPPRDTGNFRTA